jgi:pimeloyl-ACP methyl ester carboxylesterase
MLENAVSNFYRTDDHEQIFYSCNFSRADSSRPVLLFNYGLVCSNHHWKYQLGHFDRLGYQILTHDYRGHFQSSGREDLEKLTFSQMARDIHGLCASLGVERTIALGHSMGVNVCLQLAKDYPALVEAMVLISGTFMPVKDVMFDSNVMDFVAPMLQAGHEKYPGFFKKVFATGGMNPLARQIIHATGFNKKKVPREFIEIYLNRCGQLGVEVFFQLFNEMTRQNITSALEKMKVPALVIGGMKDNVIPNHLQRTLASLLPNAESYYLTDGSHVPQADFPEMINERIDLFLKRHLG